MRPSRITILALFSAASVFVLVRALTTTTGHHHHGQYAPASYPPDGRSRSLLGLVYYNTPFSLFPPNAAISLTDDNSTSFAARPAAFGPKLAAHGLSGQLWVGSGFADDSLDGNGELGCSDLPGWGSGNTRAALKNSFRAGAPRTAAARVQSDHPKRAAQLLDPDNRHAIARGRAAAPDVVAEPRDDNTDDHLNAQTARLPSRRDTSPPPQHADIQSIQEAAEIQGKIVLLMRGGCGFLEKVMWAQRRGAVAVIVGDNQKGGPLIQMFAHGDEVDNVTVPSVFTARTTAHLLSSLTQPGSFIEDSLDDSGNPVLKVQHGPKPGQDRRGRWTPTRPAPSANTASSATTTTTTTKQKRAVVSDRLSNPAPTSSGKRGWLASLFRWSKAPRAVGDESRPPSSGRLDWVLVEDWNDEKDKALKDSMGGFKKRGSAQDDFVIGVQDWRDPDLIDISGTKKSPSAEKHADAKAAESRDAEAGAAKSTANEANGPKGGSITPGSGEYNPVKVPQKDGKEAGARPASAGSGAATRGHGLMSKLFGDDDGAGAGAAADGRGKPDDKADGAADAGYDHEAELHEGLWVTITPTSSASPFFDTLLVLVVSPLVTLTVVYALLIVRARIRRRRWRAPKSVVDQLPVRTYHTVAPSPSPSPRLPSPASASPTTPLLQHNMARPRPRSRTTTGVLESENFLASPSMAAPAGPSSRGGRPEHEKGASGFSAEWKKFMGRQVECVVCLEEYVDGVSRVMSLPCGHEFHADCITPWLTTRRRTCPICKGDVVRSLAHGSRNGPHHDAYHEHSDDDVDVEASASSSGSGSGLASGSGSGSLSRSQDVDDGLASSRSRNLERPRRQDGWLGLVPNSFAARSRRQTPPPLTEDRNR